VVPHHEEKIPHEMYNFILFRCFDTCVTTFNNKTIDNTEKNCVEECVNNLKEAPLNY
jgi:hypothetical protein